MSSPALSGPAVAGVVLAAGRSSRMGRPKALLPVDGVPFVERAVATLREGGCDPVVVVVAPGEGAIAEAAEGAGARPVQNPDPEAEQVESLSLGLASIPAGPAAAVVLPVDVPLAGPDVVRTLIAAFRARGAPIVRPRHGDTPGHPVLFARDLWAELSEPDLEEGAREILHRHHDAIEDVPVDDRGILIDIDTPADYRREVGEGG